MSNEMQTYWRMSKNCNFCRKNLVTFPNIRSQFGKKWQCFTKSTCMQDPLFFSKKLRMLYFLTFLWSILSLVLFEKLLGVFLRKLLIGYTLDRSLENCFRSRACDCRFIDKFAINWQLHSWSLTGSPKVDRLKLPWIVLLLSFLLVL